MKFKVTGTKMAQNPYSCNVKLRSPITPVHKPRSNEVCVQHDMADRMVWTPYLCRDRKWPRV